MQNDSSEASKQTP